MPHITIIGGGISGLLSARELASSGAKVRLLERNEIARESSWAGGGIISPLYPWRYPDSVTLLASWSQQRFPKLCQDLAHNTGIDPEYTTSGLLMIAPDERAAAVAWADRFQHTLQHPTGPEIAELEPALARPPAEALWMPHVGQVRNPRLTKALHADVVELGVDFQTHSEVTELLHSDGRITGVRTPRGTLETEKVLICAGAWTHQLMQSLPKPPHVHPVRGQMLLFRAVPGLIRHMVLEENRYIIPRRDGRVLFGSTIEEVEFDKSTTESARDELHRIAIQRFPVLQDYPIEHHWAGLRPGSPAGVPYIARHPDIANLFVNAGHFRNGVVLAPASAQLATDLILERAPTLPKEPYTLVAPRG